MKTMVLAIPKSPNHVTLGYLAFMVKVHLKEYDHPILSWILILALIITLFHTLRSGYSFFKKNWKLVKAVHGSAL